MLGWLRSDKNYPLTTNCSQTGEFIGSGVVMTEREFALFTGQMVFWCEHCQHHHLVGHEALALERPRPRPVQRAG